jgi:hypothetical protein
VEIAASIRGRSKEYKAGNTSTTALQPTTFDFTKKRFTGSYVNYRELEIK